MSDKKVIRIGILGFGTVGQGTWKQLTENANSLSSILGVSLEPVRAAVRDLSKAREVEISTDQLTTDTQSIVDDPDIDVICELMGGVKLARELTLRAFAAGSFGEDCNAEEPRQYLEADNERVYEVRMGLNWMF